MTFGEINYGFNANILTAASLADNEEKVVIIGKNKMDINPVQQGFADIDMNNNVNIQDLIKVIHYVSGRSDEL